MARGWESKSIESQQEEVAKDKPEERPRLSPEEAKKFREKELLELARVSINGQMQASQNERYKEMLQKALADLDFKISQLTDGHKPE